MSQDLNTGVSNRYSVLAMIFFIGYCLIDVPAAFLVRKVGPALWIGFCGTTWGIVTIGQGFVKTWGQLAVCRALLGFLEGGLVPAAMFLLSVWYTRYDIHVRVAGFYVIGNASSGVAGLLAYGIEKMAGDAGLNGWRWIFIIVGGLPFGKHNASLTAGTQEGIVSTVVGLCAFFVIIDFPEKASAKNSLHLPGFLTPKESAIVLARIQHDRGDAVVDKLTWRIALGHLRDWKVWEFSSYLTLNNTALYAFSYFLPVILKDGFGYSTGKAQLMTFPPYAAAAVWLMACAFFGDHFKIRGPILIFNCLLYIIGVSMTGYAINVHTRYAGVFLGVVGIVGNVPTQWAYQHNNMVGQTKKALTMALMVMGGAFGGIISGNVFQAKEAPTYRSGLWIGIAFQVGLGKPVVSSRSPLTALQITYAALVAKNIVIFYIQNKRADRGEIIIENQPGFRHTY